MRLRVSAPIDRESALMEMVDSYDAVIENIDYAGGLVSVVVQVTQTKKAVVNQLTK
jgi:hypothetical protein